MTEAPLAPTARRRDGPFREHEGQTLSAHVSATAIGMRHFAAVATATRAISAVQRPFDARHRNADRRRSDGAARPPCPIDRCLRCELAVAFKLVSDGAPCSSLRTMPA